MSSQTQTTDSSPLVSVVIPVYNDPEGIRITLDSVTEQTYSETEYEVLVVDNGSTDETRKVIREFTDAYEHVRLLVEDEVQGSYAARNKGIERARGSLIAFIDADMTVEETWLESIVQSFREHDWDYMGAAIEMYADDSESLGATYDQLLGGFPVEDYIEERNFTVTACLTVRREVFEEVGLFDARITSQGDGEFGKRVHAAGFDQHFEPEIVMYHPARSTLRAWLKKQFRIGRGAIQLRTYHPDKAESAHPFSPRKFLPPRPRGFYERLTEVTEPTVRDTVTLYLIDYLSKLMRAVGGVYERAEQYRTGVQQ